MDAHRHQLSLSAWGAARADMAAIGPLRRALPSWAPPDTAGHFLKHADDQTVLAVAALDQAIRSENGKNSSYANWAIIAAPRFIGRAAGAATLDRFSRGGGPAISPHVIPQHSLHSPSGALSILLSSRKPNFGVGGTTDSLAEGLLAALTVPVGDCEGVLLVATSWDPEPQVDDKGNCLNEPTCFAAALAFQTAAPASCGNLCLSAVRLEAATQTIHTPPDAAELCRQLMTLVPGGPAIKLRWSYPWGGSLALEVSEHTRIHSVAA